MGSGSSGLPRRVNLVYDGRFVLVKRRTGDCRAESMSLTDMLASPKGRFGWEQKWIIRVEEYDQARPSVVIIRNDRHPQRSLRATQPVTIDSDKWTPQHRWAMDYLHRDRRVNAVAVVCYLRSMADGNYLAVDEASGEVLMQAQKPPFAWELHNAAATDLTPVHNKPACGSFPSEEFFDCSSQSSFDEMLDAANCETFCDRCSARCKLSNSPCLRGCNAARGTQRALPQSPRLQGSDAEVAERHPLQWLSFDGSLSDAFKSHTCSCDGTLRYTPLDEFVRVGCSLGDGIEVGHPPMTLEAVFHALLGRQSKFRCQLTDGDDPVVSPIKRIQQSPWIYVGRTSQLIKVRVKGKLPFEEELRVASCLDTLDAIMRRADGRRPHPVMAFHFSSVLRFGWPAGDITAEVLHLFSQEDETSPVVLWSFGLVPPGSLQKRTLDGLQEARKRFVEIVLLWLRAAETDQSALSDSAEAAPPQGTSGEKLCVVFARACQKGQTCFSGVGLGECMNFRSVGWSQRRS